MTEVSDPRVRGIVVSGVEVSRDLGYAKIFVFAPVALDRAREAPPGTARSPADTSLAGVRHAAPFLRRRLAAKLNIRAVPALRFELDPTPERAERIESLLDGSAKS